MKTTFLCLIGICIGFASLSNAKSTSAGNNNSDGYLVEIKDIHSKTVQKLIQSGQMELLQLSFGNFGYFTNKSANSNFSTSFAFSHRGPFSSIEPNVTYTASDDGTATIQDKNWYAQWALNNTGKNNWANAPAGEDVKALDAWKITKGSNDLIIAVLDSGVEVHHPDIAENIYTNLAEKNGQAGVDDDGNGYIDDVHGFDFAYNDPVTEDVLGHGTHVAGLIGARHNSIGIAGIMNNVQILPLKFLNNERKGDTKHAILAIDYAIKMGAKIINGSFSATSPSDVLQKAIQAANEKGILYVTSAGNSKNDNDKNPVFPCGFDVPNIVCVGASNPKGTLASFSNYGKSYVDVFAPGTMIVSITPDDKNMWKSGTSMATPIVAGALGLLLSEFPGMDVQTAKARLMETSDNKENFKEVGIAGRVNIYRLLTGK